MMQSTLSHITKRIEQLEAAIGRDNSQTKVFAKSPEGLETYLYSYPDSTPRKFIVLTGADFDPTISIESYKQTVYRTRRDS